MVSAVPSHIHLRLHTLALAPRRMLYLVSRVLPAPQPHLNSVLLSDKQSGMYLVRFALTLRH
jgi:hypothetical protein